VLWRHKDSLQFYEVFNGFVSVFKGFFFGKDTPRISTHASKFLDKKGTLEKIENYNVIRFFGSKENTSFLPCHISNKMFITEVTRQYNFWLLFFHEKRKNKFRPFPWKNGDFVFRNMNKIDEFANHFHNMNLKYVGRIKWFDPKGIFVEHMLAMGFRNSFIHIVLAEEEDNNLGATTHNVGDLEIVLSTNEFYKHKVKGLNEKSAQSPTINPNNSTSWSSVPVDHPYRKVINNSLSGGGEKNCSPGKIETSHKLPLRKKRENIVQEEEDPHVESDINRLSLEDIEIEAGIEKIFPNINHPGSTTHHNSSLEIVENETFDEEESFFLQSGFFDKDSKKLIIEKSDVKN
jgi:hypothetical protein